MTSAIRNMSFLILLLIPTIGQCGGYASWWQTTKLGNTVCKERGSNGYAIGIKCKELRRPEPFHENWHLVSNISRWYFYNNYIVGETEEKGQIRYFLFDELSCESQIYQEEEVFERRIHELQLKPSLWTRWYHSNWGFFITDGHILDKLNVAFVKVPVVVLFGIVMLIGLVRTRFRLRHPFNVISLIIFIGIVVRLLLDVYPGSI